MKNIPIYYLFQNNKEDKDKDFSVFAIPNTFPSIFEVKVRDVLTNFPLLKRQPNKNYHFRFKTVCTEIEPKMSAWLDISNFDAKVPIINNAVYMKILILPSRNSSRVYNNNSMDQLLGTNSSLPPAQSLKKNPSEMGSASKSETSDLRKELSTPKNLENNLNGHRSHSFPSDLNLLEKQAERKSADTNLLHVDEEPVEDLNSKTGPIQATPEKPKPIPENDDNLMTFETNSSSFRPVVPNTLSNTPSKKDFAVNLLVTGEEERAPGTKTVPKLNEEDQRVINIKVNQAIELQREAWEAQTEMMESRLKAKMELDEVIDKWAKKNGTRNNIITLLVTLNDVLWENAEWEQLSVGQLFTDNDIKKAMMKVRRVVHPDKHQGSEYRKKYIAERIFIELNEAYKEKIK